MAPFLSPDTVGAKFLAAPMGRGNCRLSVVGFRFHFPRLFVPLPFRFPMKILHTSDWHLGRLLYNQKRYDESGAFLEWLLLLIDQEQIDALLVAGDVFDTTTPSNRAQELYYGFLAGISKTNCRHVVIIGGNHDSPTFLDAPKSLLNWLDIHVVGAISENPEEEIFILNDSKGEAEAIVCAVPYLRDRDVRSAEFGESSADKTRKLLLGISNHYREIATLARKHQKGNAELPVIGMGHLFTRNAVTTEGDGVRELYIGSIAHVDEQEISAGFDYMALGHLHLAQTAGGSDTVRYSGSPVPMSFAEAGQTKIVITVDFQKGRPVVREHPVPCFKELKRLSGTLESISDKIRELIDRGSSAWLEVELTAYSSEGSITDYFDELLKGASLEILRIKNKTVVDKALTPLHESETLEQLDPSVVFDRCLDAFEVPDEQREALKETYDEALNSFQRADINAD